MIISLFNIYDTENIFIFVCIIHDIETDLYMWSVSHKKKKKKKNNYALDGTVTFVWLLSQFRSPGYNGTPHEAASAPAQRRVGIQHNRWRTSSMACLPERGSFPGRKCFVYQLWSQQPREKGVQVTGSLCVTYIFNIFRKFRLMQGMYFNQNNQHNRHFVGPPRQGSQHRKLLGVWFESVWKQTCK